MAHAVAAPLICAAGPNDNVFINFDDHGGPGIIAFPTTTMSAKRLNEALTYMHKNGMYSQLLFYLEACESGATHAITDACIYTSRLHVQHAAQEGPECGCMSSTPR